MKNEPVCLNRYLFTLDLPEYWENKHADQTLEVLMSDLDPAIMDQFYMKDGVSASDVTRVSGTCHQNSSENLIWLPVCFELFLTGFSSPLVADEWNS